jgi:hypothetical protein
MARIHSSKLNSWPSLKYSRELILNSQILWLGLGPILWLGLLTLIRAAGSHRFRALPVSLRWVFCFYWAVGRPCRQPMLTYNTNPWSFRLSLKRPVTHFKFPNDHFEVITWRLQLQCSMPQCNQSGHSIRVVTIQTRSGDRDAGGSGEAGTWEPRNTAAKSANSTRNMLYNTPAT